MAFARRTALAIERGEVASGTDPDAILGAVIFRVVFLQQPAGSFAESLTDLLLGSRLRR